MRALFLIVAALFVLAIPVGSAQGAKIQFVAEISDPAVDVPDTGRTDVPIVVKGTIEGTVCQQIDFVVSLKLDSFAKWAGASLEPHDLRFTVPAGAYISPTQLPAQETALNLAWDLEAAPRKGATQDYYITIPSAFPKNGGPCAPPPSEIGGKFGPVTATLVDRVDAPTPTDNECAVDPFLPACTTSISPIVTTPGFGGPLLVAAIGALVVALRKRTRPD